MIKSASQFLHSILLAGIFKGIQKQEHCRVFMKKEFCICNSVCVTNLIENYVVINKQSKHIQSVMHLE